MCEEIPEDFVKFVKREYGAKEEQIICKHSALGSSKCSKCGITWKSRIIISAMLKGWKAGYELGHEDA